MDRKTLRKVRKEFVKRNYYYYGENTNTYKSYEPSISIRIDDDREAAPATVEITVDIERLSTEMDIPGLLKPALENGYNLVEIIRGKYGELSNILPFDRFYLSELTYTSWINFPDKELTGEYIHLLKQSIFQNDRAIFGTREFETDPDKAWLFHMVFCQITILHSTGRLTMGCLMHPHSWLESAIITSNPLIKN